MSNRNLSARLRLTGANQVRQAIEGTASKAREESRRTRQAQKRAIAAMAQDVRRAERTKQRAHRRTEREAIQAARAEQRARKRAIDAMVRETRKAERQRRAEFERTRRLEEQRQRRARMQRHRARSGMGDAVLGSLPGGLGSGAAGVAAAGAGALAAAMRGALEEMSQVRRAVQQNAGLQERGQRVVTAQELDLEIRRLSGEVFPGQTGEELEASQRALRAQVAQTAAQTGQDPLELLEALGNLQTEFSAFDFGRENLAAFAREAVRTGAPVRDLARFAGLVRQQFGEMEPDRVFDILAQGGLQGAMTPESLSEHHAGNLGLYASFVDPSGSTTPEDRLRGFVALANVLRQSGLDDAESANLLPQMFTSLRRREVQQNIAVATGGRRRGNQVIGGVQMQDFRDEQGNLDLAGYIEAIQASGGLGNLEVVGNAVGDQGATQALNTLIAARRRNIENPEEGVDIRELMSVSAEEGAAFRDNNYANVHASAAMRQRRAAIEANLGVGTAEEESAQSLAATRISAQLDRTTVAGLPLGAAAETVLDNTYGLDLLSWIASDDSRRSIASGGLRALGSIAGPGVGDALARVLDITTAPGARTAGARGGDTAGLRDATRQGVRDAVREGPIDVRIVGGGAGAPSAEGPRRSQSPRERT
jgi:hypothetical protein